MKSVPEEQLPLTHPTPADRSADRQGSDGRGHELAAVGFMASAKTLNGLQRTGAQTECLDFSFNLPRREAFPELGLAAGRDNRLEHAFVYSY